jgi:hypothetical protein
MEQMMMKLLVATTFAIGLTVAPAAQAQQSITPGLQGQGSTKSSGGGAVTAPGTRIQGEGATSGTVGASGSSGQVGGGAESGASIRGGGAVGGGVKANGNLNTR